MMKEYGFVIPAYNPDEMLIEVVKKLQKENKKIFVVDDGSEGETQYIFKKLLTEEYCKNVILFKHAVNLGKGAALKTAFNRILTEYPNIVGIVTLDSDGQHSVKDCLRVLDELKGDDKAFVLGYRTFSSNIPLKSYIGNNISKFIYKLVLGRTFQDTQTGLRGLSKDFMKQCLTIKSNRFEFETEQLAIAANQSNKINIKEIAIETIYIENNKATSFRPLVDSFKIYFVLFRYGFSSILTATTDFIVFLIALHFGSSIFVANMLARTASIGVQYTLLNALVFHTQAKWKNFIFFVSYVYIMGIFSIWAQLNFVATVGVSEISAKVIIEAILFFINFAFLKLYIFNKDND